MTSSRKKLHKEIVEKFSSFNIDVSEFAKRLSHGTKGRSIKLYSNLFKLNFPTTEIFHYDIQVKDKDSKSIQNIAKWKLNLIISEFIKQHNNDIFANKVIATDFSKILLSKNDIHSVDGKVFTSNVFFDGTEGPQSTFLIELKFAKVLQLRNDNRKRGLREDEIQVIDILLKHGMISKGIVVGSNIFIPSPDKTKEFADNIIRRIGQHQSARLCERGWFVNVDRAIATFHKEGMIVDIFRNLLRSDELCIRSRKQFDTLNSYITGLKMQVIHLDFKRKSIIKGLTDKPISQVNFTNDDGNQISVLDYFTNKYPTYSYNPNLPCIITGTEKKRYWPLEVCQLTENQLYRTSKQQNVCMVLDTPDKVLESITKMTSLIIDNGRKLLDHFNIKIDKWPISLNGRVLDPPNIILDRKTNNFIPVNNGTWDQKSFPFYLPATSKLNTVIYSKSRIVPNQALKIFQNSLCNLAEKNGLIINVVQNTLINNIENAFKNLPHSVNLIIFILSERSDYSQVKIFGTRQFGIITQVVNDRNYNRQRNVNDIRAHKMLSEAYLGNLLLKINFKCGGINAFVDMPEDYIRNTMFVGVDVVHPKLGSNDGSIASCVASFGKDFPRCITKNKVQEARVEIINQLSELIFSHLEEFKKRQQYADWIVIFRDGVSEGQLKDAFFREVQPILDMLHKYNSQINLTYIVVSKRNKKRLFTGRNRNIPAGTVVDHTITNPVLYEFLLNAHNSPIGCARTPSYVVLYNDKPLQQFNQDNIEELTNSLCYSFQRCKTSISIPSICKFADLAAYHAQILLTDGKKSLIPSQRIRVHPNIASKMYYM